MWRRIYLGHSTTSLSSITLNHVFYMKLSVLRNALSFYFNWFLFSLVFCFWKVTEFQVNVSQSSIKVNPNRRLCGNASPVGFCSVFSVFFPLYLFANPSFHLWAFTFLPLDQSICSSCLPKSSSLVRWRSLSTPLLDASSLCRMFKVRHHELSCSLFLPLVCLYLLATIPTSVFSLPWIG